MPDSCFVAKLKHYIDLNDSEQELLAKLEANQSSFAKRAEVYSSGEKVDALYIVKTGWLYSYTDLPDGRRQIVRIHHPGDLVGIPDLAFNHCTTSLRTCTDAVLCPMPKTALDDIFIQSARLTALLFTITNRDQVVFIELLRAISRMDARERLSHLFLQLLSRLRITNPDIGATFRLPLNQHEIGDAIGLSHVYVSKTLGRMEADGYIRRDGREITLLREDELVELTDFVDRYHDMDTSWFPSRR